MAQKTRLEAHHCIEISFSRLSERYGCGLMLKNLPRLGGPDPLLNVMGNYGFTNLQADVPARRHLENSGLLKQFYDNAFAGKVPLRQNFKQVYGHLDLFLAFDPTLKAAWFVADPQNRMALGNYFRDAVSLGMKSLGVVLTGSLVRLNAVGWQNLHDILSDRLFEQHRDINRVEVLSVISGVRWRPPCLSLGVTALNFRELPELVSALKEALGEAGSEVET